MRNFLITGASGPLGREVLEKFLKKHRVFATHHRSEPTDLESHENLHWVDMDVADPRSVHLGLQSLTTKFGPVDGLLHCAGGFRFAKIDETSDEDMEFLLHANLKSAMVLVREVLPSMKEKNFGRIVMVGAQSAVNPGAGISVFAATKAGLHAFVASVADEVRPFNINITAVLPTIIDTPINRRDMPQANFNQWVKASEIADVMLTLTSDIGNSINGACIPVSGRL